MNEAASSVEPEVKTRFDILFVKILKLYSFFLNQFYFQGVDKSVSTEMKSHQLFY
jgi:hypothetical protein